MISRKINLDRFYQKCKQHSLKITPQRTAVYKTLEASSSHPCADMIHKVLQKEFPNISLDTVNRTLITFSKVNIIDVVEGRGDPRRFDPNLDAHHHFHCLACNKIFDFHDTALDQITPSSDIAKKFIITGKKIVLKGYCDNCRSQASTL